MFRKRKIKEEDNTNKKKTIDFIYKIHNTPLSKTDSAKYLGVVIDFDSKLYLTPHYYSNQIKTFKNTLSFIKRNLPKASFTVKNKCYTTLIRPKAEYASAVWDTHNEFHIDNNAKGMKILVSRPRPRKF